MTRHSIAREFAFVKAHAYGNDFLFMKKGAVQAVDAAAIARAACDRHRGVGADGLIVYQRTSNGATMRLFNADGGVAEVSGNGVRCLAAILVDSSEATVYGPDREIIIETDGGVKTVWLLKATPPSYRFRVFMGVPAGLEQVELNVAGERVSAVVMSMGNPQCVVLDSSLNDERFRRLGPGIATHSTFPNGTNVEFVTVEHPGQVRILIWERGVGPTLSSGTGACASVVASAVYGTADRVADVISLGGTQHVEWESDGVYLTGWAEISVRGKWIDSGVSVV